MITFLRYNFNKKFNGWMTLLVPLIVLFNFQVFSSFECFWEFVLLLMTNWHLLFCGLDLLAEAESGDAAFPVTELFATATSPVQSGATEDDSGDAGIRRRASAKA